MELSVDRERCVGAGMCVLGVPEVFDQDAEDGRVLVLDAEPPPGRRASVRLAAGVCPAGAITVRE
ncbi:ferredoxin [Streptomyces varsoviensis]|uniref:Ferredoxin n=1 Tax=Streptomyces varsoviensis TaxID=67373 RepID=A0ABR5J3I2_9ACTN|nr:ferredoxin [Streptomyces varsoviensis]KOG87979.1 ferredoxin [Streptomyces varsoviensis]